MIPYILIGLIRAHAIGWKIAVTAEVFVSADGIGFMINNFYKLIDNSRLFACVIIVVINGVFFDFLLIRLKGFLFKNYETTTFNNIFNKKI